MRGAVRCGKEGSEMRDERPNFRRTTNETRAQTRGKNDRKKRFATHRAWLRSRSECSLNRRMSGKLARWPPGFIVKSRGWFVICFARHDGPKQATIRGESSEHPQSIMKERLQALMGFLAHAPRADLLRLRRGRGGGKFRDPACVSVRYLLSVARSSQRSAESVQSSL